MSIFDCKNKKSEQHNSNYNCCNIDYDKLAMSIVKAHSIMAENQEKEEKNEIAEWHRIIGYKEIPQGLSPIKQRSFEIRNSLTVFFRILFKVKREDIKTAIINNGLMKIFISLAYSALEYILYVLILAFAIALITDISIQNAILFGCLGFISLVFARIFRIASVEVEKIKDNSYLIGLFSAITSFIAMVATLIALFKGVG